MAFEGLEDEASEAGSALPDVEVFLVSLDRPAEIEDSWDTVGTEGIESTLLAPSSATYGGGGEPVATFGICYKESEIVDN